MQNTSYAAAANRAEIARVAAALVRRFEDPSESVALTPEQFFAAALAIVHDATVEGSAYTEKQVGGYVMAAVRIARSYSL